MSGRLFANRVVRASSLSATAAAVILSSHVCFAAVRKAGAPTAKPAARLMDRLSVLREQSASVEKNLVEGLRSQKEAKANIIRIRKLLKLQEEERKLSLGRIQELENTVGELERRRGELRERIQIQQASIRSSLRDLDRSAREVPKSMHLHERERIEAPRRKVLAAIVDRSIKDIEVHKADLADADRLEARIQEERQELAYIVQELQERDSVLELNRKLQADMVLSRHEERARQLETYHRLKSAESHVERMIHDFSARMELKDSLDSERKMARQHQIQQEENERMLKSAFYRSKGQLGLPVAGRVISQFGRALDQRTQLHIFRKGIDIQSEPGTLVRAVAPGKIAYSGEMAGFGRIAIIDHGDHFYSLCGNLGSLERKVGDAVLPGDALGKSDPSGIPVYFEIRARNIAVNPLQWVADARKYQ